MAYGLKLNTFIIVEVEEVIIIIDDHLISIQTMKSNRYVSKSLEMLEMWEIKLLLMQEVIDSWLAVQRGWIKLESIFQAADIRIQLPVETQKFNQVDKFWKELMNGVKKRPLVENACKKEDMKTRFDSMQVILEDIMKKLEVYLELKRQSFYRFYFLSNKDLLMLLS